METLNGNVLLQSKIAPSANSDKTLKIPLEVRNGTADTGVLGISLSRFSRNLSPGLCQKTELQFLFFKYARHHDEDKKESRRDLYTSRE